MAAVRRVNISAFENISNVNVAYDILTTRPPNHVHCKVLCSCFSDSDINTSLGKYVFQKKHPEHQDTALSIASLPTDPPPQDLRLEILLRA